MSRLTRADMLGMLRLYQADAEQDTAIWADNHDRWHAAARILAHHRIIRAALLALAAPLLAILGACWAVREAGRIIDQSHAVSGPYTCNRCASDDADEFARRGTVTYADACHAWETSDAGLEDL